MNYYETLGSVRVYKKDGTVGIFKNAEGCATGNFYIIYQNKLKTVFPLEEIVKITNENLK